MGTAICMNKSCRTSSSSEWKSGWPLRSGGFATLCFVCGSAFENLVYCETFHREESGWRECDSCKKPIHCGCASSKPFIEFLDLGGACCITCAKKFAQHSIRRDEVLNDYSTQMLSSVGSLPHNMGDTRINEDIVGKGRIFQLGKSKMDGDPNLLPQIPKGEANVSLGTINGEDVIPSYRELSSNFWNLNAQSGCSPHYPIAGSNVTLGVQDGFEANPQTSLNISLSTPPDPSNYSAKYPSVVMEGRDSINLPSPSQQGQRPRVILPKPSKSGLGLSMDASKGVVQQPRVARPPAEGRGRNQLLPRYWPRITDQELQQLSGDLNSPVVPLFEKVLSASDAGRIGRLVLPKACAEAYFPPISQSEGTPIRIQDAKGKEWTFQFRFWPNNNSRMYVLEGVTPCIQSMQLQAGDTVIFSRRDPGGKLVIGSRKASVSSDTQDGEIAALANGTNGESSFSGVSTASGYSGTFQSMTENRNTHLHGLSEHMTAADSNVGWSKSDRNRGRIAENSVPLSMVKRPQELQDARAAGCRTSSEAKRYIEQKRKEAEESARKEMENNQPGPGGKALMRANHIKGDFDSSPRGGPRRSMVLESGSKDLCSPNVGHSLASSIDVWDVSGFPGADLLSDAEKQLCCEIRILPAHYLSMMQTISMGMLSGNITQKSDAYSLFKVDSSKVDRVYDELLKKGFTPH